MRSFFPNLPTTLAFFREALYNSIAYPCAKSKVIWACKKIFSEGAARMRILHTSDWHIGKRLMDRDRLPEQIGALEQIIRICDEKEVDLVLVAGDIFDTYLPPAEAEAVFYRTVLRLAENRAVVIVSGNHDDGVRLAASAPLAAGQGIYLFGGPPQGGQAAPRRVWASEIGPNHAVIAKGEERVYVNALPYPNEARIKAAWNNSYGETVRALIAAGDAAYDGKMPHILLSHLFVANGKNSEGERDISLGGARMVPLDVFPKYGYTALGHLHKRQKWGDRIRYSGSLLQYSFDEAGMEKGVVLLESAGGDIAVKEEIPLKAEKQLMRLEVSGVEEGIALISSLENCYIELTLHLTAPLTGEDTRRLRAANEGLVSLIPIVKGGEVSEIVRRSDLNAEELFREYYRVKCGAEPEEETVKEFLLLIGEAEA